MSLKPDHTAADLRALMDQFATAAEPATPAAQANRIRQQLSEMDYGGGRSPHAGMGLPRDDDDGNIVGRKEIIVKPETAKKTVKSVGDKLDQAFAQAYDDKGVKEGSAGWMLRQDPALAKKVRDNTQGYKDLKKMAGKPVPKKDEKGVAEGRAGADDRDTVGFSVNSEAAYNAVMQRFGDYVDHDETSGIMSAPARMWPRIEMVAFDADPESGAVRVEDDVMEQGVAEAKSLARRVRVVKTGETGTIRQIKHGAHKGAPKTYYVDLDNGDQADNLPASALRLIKGEVAEVKSKTHPEHSAMDTPAVQGAIAGMKQRHEKEPFDLEKARVLGQKLAARNRDPRRK